MNENGNINIEVYAKNSGNPGDLPKWHVSIDGKEFDFGEFMQGVVNAFCSSNLAEQGRHAGAVLGLAAVSIVTDTTDLLIDEAGRYLRAVVSAFEIRNHMYGK